MDILNWHRWFAWRPVLVENYWVWWEPVWRKGDGWYDGIDWSYKLWKNGHEHARG